MRFSRQEYWSGLPCPPPWDLPHPGIKPISPALQGRFITTEPPGKPLAISNPRIRMKKEREGVLGVSKDPCNASCCWWAPPPVSQTPQHPQDTCAGLKPTEVSDCPSSVQFSSVAQSCPTLCDPMNRSTPGLPVHHQLPEFTQTHVRRVSDAIQPSQPLSWPSPLAPNPSQHQGLFQWVNSSHEVAKVLEFQLQHQSFQWTPRTDLL